MVREVLPPLSIRLGDAVSERLDARHQLPFWVAVRERTLPLAGYCAHLGAWATVWKYMEEMGTSEAATLWSDDLIFSGLLRADRTFLVPLCAETDRGCERPAEMLGRQLAAGFKAERVSFLGALYVMTRLLTEALPLDECAHASYGLALSGRVFWRYQVHGASQRFRQLTTRLDALPSSARLAERVESAARITLASYLDIERSISPGTNLSVGLAAMRTPPGSLAPPRPNQGQSAPPSSQPAAAQSDGCGILRGAPNLRRPR